MIELIDANFENYIGQPRIPEMAYQMVAHTTLLRRNVGWFILLALTYKISCPQTTLSVLIVMVSAFFYYFTLRQIAGQVP
jgi:hypothetical protein